MGAGHSRMLAAAMLVFAAMMIACGGKAPKVDLSKLPPPRPLNIVPAPVSLQLGKGAIALDGSTRILWERGNPDARRAAGYLFDCTTRLTSTTLELAPEPFFGRPPNTILLTSSGSKEDMGAEGYRFTIDTKGVTIRARQHGGFVAGIATLRQILPPPGSGDVLPVVLPALDIRDQPRFAWRGMHLDVCRHFMPVEFVKKYIDTMAQYKFNVFHWHLTEDQGWRIEIKRYPRLAEVGAWRFEQGGAYGGFYTQDEIRDVVKYAAERGITIVPEIEMPGHALAALAAYPELSCTGGPFEVGTKWGVYDDVYCAGNEKTFEMLEGVLTEVIALFPSQYVHIGGDECPKARWKECPRCQARIKAEGLKDEDELQSYFVRRIEAWLNEHDRKLIGWDEILEGGLAPRATVMSWRGIKGGIHAARERHDVVMSPTSHMYFDYRQSLEPGEPGAGYTKTVIDLEKVYSFEPVPEELSPTEAKHILGGQTNVWTERLSTPSAVEYMVLPRMCALSEVLWSPKASHNYDDFKKRIATHYARFAAQESNYKRY